MVSFRLSAEEYAKFRTICEARGIRSISDLARTAVYRLAASKDHPDPLWDEVGALRTQIMYLADELERVAKVLEARQTSR